MRFRHVWSSWVVRGLLGCAGVFVGLGGFFDGGLLCGGAAGCVRADEPPASNPTPNAAEKDADWQTLEPKEEGFRIDLPGKPEPQGGELETPDGTTYVRVYTLADDAKRRLYSVGANRLPVAPKPDDVKGLLDRTRDGAVKLIGGQVLDEHDVLHAMYRGRALTAAAKNLYVHARIFVADDRMYQISIVSSEQKPTADDLRVFDSFKIMPGKLVDPPPKYDWRFVTPKDEKFAVDFPTDPHEQRAMLDTPIGRTAMLRMESRPGSRIYFLQVCDFPTATVGTDTAQFDAARAQAIRLTGGKLVDETDASRSGRSGRDIKIVAGEKTLWSRVLLDGSRIYQLGVVGAGEATAEDRRFLDSLKFPPK